MKRSPIERWLALAMLAVATGLTAFDAIGRSSARAAPPSSEDGETSARAERPKMQSLAPSTRAGTVPSQRTLVDARATFRRRYGNPAARARTATATLLVAEALIAEASTEADAAVKWVIFDEARKLAISAGSPLIIGRAVRLASSEFEFDALNVEYRSLLEIPLRALDPGRASELADAATAVATRAELDRRFDLAMLAQGLAIRAWQRADNIHAARAATRRLDVLEQMSKVTPPGLP